MAQLSTAKLDDLCRTKAPDCPVENLAVRCNSLRNTAHAARTTDGDILDARSLMAVNLRWALALACAAGVRGKHSTPP
eukprot:scaffold27237_cov83-Phaeocystis_antarctica.AAC.2